MAIEAPALRLALPASRVQEGVADQANGPGGVAVFEDMLKDMAISANQRIHEAQGTAEAFAAGTRDDIHGTMLALSKADIELKVLGNVRNRVVDAFYELWRMQV